MKGREQYKLAIAGIYLHVFTMKLINREKTAKHN